MNSKQISFLYFILVGLSVFTQTYAQTCSCDTPLTAATFNVLQIPFSPFRSERFDQTIPFLQRAENQFDILCLQELFEPAQRNRIKEELAGIYPFSLDAPKVNDTCTPRCSDDDVNTILTCVAGNICLVEDGISAISCLIDNCDTVV